MRRTLIAIIILAMAIAGFIWLKNSAPKTPAKPRLPPAVNVKTITVIKQSLSPEVQLYGRLDSPVVSKLTAAVEADIKMVHTREGEMVDAQHRVAYARQHAMGECLWRAAAQRCAREGLGATFQPILRRRA